MSSFSFQWNDTRTDYPRDKCVHQVFEAQVERNPDAIAASLGSEQLSYRDLNLRANRLAHRLRKSGVGPEVLVGICMERSLEMIVGLLGVLKAGGGYLPLDPLYPSQRLAFMLDDANIPLLLMQKKTLTQLPEDTRRKRTVICLDGEDWKGIAACELTPASDVRATNLAYVMYTSGSSGKPKGVAVPHRGIVRLVCGIDYVQLNEHQIILHIASASFDASTFEIWGALLHGARCALFPARVPTPRELRDVIQESKVTTLIMTTSLFNTVIIEAPEAFSGVRQLLVGGEALSAPHVQRALQLMPGARIINAYGPTESTTLACCYDVPNRLQDSQPSIPIGHPIANTQVYIVGNDLRPVPGGMAGELCIGGDGLARGYLNQQALTAEKFVPNPFSSEPGSRLYKTGDLGRCLPEGKIEFVGRIDDQIKIRGFRIEPGEIEAALNCHPAIRHAAVVAREDRPGQRRLVAYIVLSQPLTKATRLLRRHLKQRLPEYMVPDLFVPLEELPLTVNGKVDRARLPVPEPRPSEVDSGFVSPKTAIEKKLASIWSDVIGVDRVGIYDDFLQLGGHSLAAIQVLCRVAETFKVDIPLGYLFEKSTVAELATLLQERLLEQSEAFSPIPRIPRNQPLPMSSSQRRVWFVQQLDAGNLSYNFQALLQFHGILHVAALEQSLCEILRRHEIYRTTFDAIDGRPIQIVHNAEPFELEVLDLGKLDEPERQIQRDELIGKELRKSFALTELPLIRWKLIRLNERDHVLIHVEHHLLHDGWSFNVFLSELLEIYAAFASGGISPLPEPKIQFADYAYWQQEWLESKAAETQLAFWTTKLAASSFLLDLPLDRPRPARQSFRGASQRHELSLDLCDALRTLSRNENVTLFMTMLTGFVALLHRYSGQADFCVGSGVANRSRREIEGLIGMVINNVVLRTDVSGDPTIYQLLDRVHGTTLEAYEHQELPFDKIVEAVHPERDLSHNPLFQVMFGFHDAPMPWLEVPGIEVDVTVGLSNGSAKFDLNLVVIPHSEQHISGASGTMSQGLSLIWEYSTDLFDDATIKRMIRHYENALQSMVVNPAWRISELPLIDEDERHQLLSTWNDTARDYPKHKCIHEVFEDHVEQTPDAIAVVFGEQRLTYRELNQRANRLAHRLKALGVRPDVLIALLLERSPETVISMLAVLKCGGAYVPVDPDYPKHRVLMILEETRAPVILTQSRFIERFSCLPQRALCLDSDWQMIAAEDDENLQLSCDDDNLAYVIYTSGSTGKPKGVAVSHSAVNRLVLGTDYIEPTREDRIAHVSTCSFDAATFEIWAALLNGARLVGLSTETLLSPKALAVEVQKHEISMMFLTTALFNQLVTDTPDCFRSLRCLLFGGENADPDCVAKILENGAPEQLLHVYGPTETTTFATCYRVRSVSSEQSTVPIGRPIANTRAFILDSNFHPVPIGVRGELYIGGDGVARGYLREPGLTAERFLPDPFSKEAGARLYKTGDLARYLASGDIEFIGRSDFQVKIRGYRIELEEIESALSQHPAVRQTVVIVREDIARDKRLIAYVVSTQNSTASAEELRQFLKERLPDYMLPSAFVFCERLPLTSNGKVDRQALSVPDQSRRDLAETFVAPRTQSEEILAAIWSNLLSVQRVGVHDNFFELGGHSLLASQVISRVHDTFGLDLPLRTVFETPTINELANMIDIATVGGSKTPAGTITPVSRQSYTVKLS